MSPWLLDHLNHILLGLGGTTLSGLVIVIIRLSVKQSVRLYQDDLVQCQNARKGDAETIARQKEAILFLEERSDYRDKVMKEMVSENAETRAYTNQLVAMMQRQTLPSTPLNEKKPLLDGSESVSSP